MGFRELKNLRVLSYKLERLHQVPDDEVQTRLHVRAQLQIHAVAAEFNPKSRMFCLLPRPLAQRLEDISRVGV